MQKAPRSGGMFADRWDPRHFERNSVTPAGGSGAAEEFGVPLKDRGFGDWKVWVLLDVVYLAVALWVIGMMEIVNPYWLDLHNPAILLIGVLLAAYFVGGYALLLFGAYRVWQRRTRALHP